MKNICTLCGEKVEDHRKSHLKHKHGIDDGNVKFYFVEESARDEAETVQRMWDLSG